MWDISPGCDMNRVVRLAVSVSASMGSFGFFCARAPADAKSDYEMLYGAREKKVLATKSTADDAALAGELLASAKHLADSPKLQAILYEKAYEFGAKDLAGHAHALEALALLEKAAPDRNRRMYRTARRPIVSRQS